jgi:hypothetical protein
VEVAVEAEVEAAEEVVVAAHQRHLLPPNNPFHWQQTSRLWEDFPKSSAEIVLEPTTSSKK